jgi:multidrug efflux pump subunit AcrB
LLVPLVILCALSLAVTGAFVALTVTGHALDLSTLIDLLMLMGVVVTNAIVLLAVV